MLASELPHPTLGGRIGHKGIAHYLHCVISNGVLLVAEAPLMLVKCNTEWLTRMVPPGVMSLSGPSGRSHLSSVTQTNFWFHPITFVMYIYIVSFIIIDFKVKQCLSHPSLFTVSVEFWWSKWPPSYYGWLTKARPHQRGSVREECA